MAGRCVKCVEDAGENDSIKCYGKCGDLYHISCLAEENINYRKVLIEYLRKLPNLQWYCDECIPQVLNGKPSGSANTKSKRTSSDKSKPDKLVKNSREEEKKRKKLTTSISKFKCNYCPRKFPTEIARRGHLSSHTKKKKEKSIAKKFILPKYFRTKKPALA